MRFFSEICSINQVLLVASELKVYTVCSYAVPVETLLLEVYELLNIYKQN